MSRKYKQEDILVETSTLENVNNKTQNDIDTAENKISSIKNDIETLQVNIEENSSALLLIVRGSENFEGKDVTAKCKLDNSEYTGTIQNGVCILKVKMPGEYVITNTFNETTITCTIGEPLIDEVYFTDYYGSINVTVPEMLIGETLVAVNEHHTTEKVITSTIEIIDVYFKGSWEVKIKDTEYISGQSVELQELGQSASVSFVSLESVPYITVTLCDELKGERVVCTSDNDYTRTKSPKNGSVQFFCPKAGSYTVALELSDKIQKQVEVSATQEYPVTLDLTELTTPVLIVKSKEEDNGKTIKVSKDETNLERVLADRVALFVLPEQGEYSIKCDDYPDITRTVNAIENKVYNIAYRAIIFGLKVNQGESDPQKRIEPLEDLVGLIPITVDSSSRVVNYGDMKDTFLYKAMDNPCLLSIDGQEEIPLNPDNYTQRKEGGAAPTCNSSSNYNTMNRVDKLYTYEYEKDGYEYYYISPEKVDDNYTAIGFTREDGSEADCFYIGAYLGLKDNQDRIRSVPDDWIFDNGSFEVTSGFAEKNGEGYSLLQYQMVEFYINAFLMLFQNFNCKKTIGNGRKMNWGSYTDHPNEKTGVLKTNGPIAVEELHYIIEQSVKFMHVEDIWLYEGYGTYVTGLISQNYKIYTRMKPSYVKDDKTSLETYTEAIDTKGFKEGYEVFTSSSSVNNKWGRVPKAYKGSDSTYECSQFYSMNNENRATYLHGHGSIFSFATRGITTYNHGQISRLCYLPPAE